MEFKLRNGHFVGASFDYCEDKKHVGGRLSGPPTLEDPNPIGELSGKAAEMSIVIEVFETADPPEHRWHPGPGSGGYRVLWRKTFTVSAERHTR